ISYIENLVYSFGNFQSILIILFVESSKQGGVCCPKLSKCLKLPNQESLLYSNSISYIQHLPFSFGNFWLILAILFANSSNKEFVTGKFPNVSRSHFKSIHFSGIEFVVSSTLSSHLAIFFQFCTFYLWSVQSKEFVAQNVSNISMYQIKRLCCTLTQFVISSI
ncbi:hypothetical protein PanWU01x14_363420, partial [Parasponia andersonii]